jgi:hypothetical protein
MTINIDTHALRRFAAATAAIAGVGAAAFFGGQTTRMSDEARANERHAATTAAVAKADERHAAELATVKVDAKTHERKAVKRAIKGERKRAERLAATARSEGYSAGNSAGYGAGHSDGYSEGNEEGYSEGNEEGVEEGIEQASDELECSDDLDVPLPFCDY